MAFKTVSQLTLYGFDNGKFPNLGFGVLTSGWSGSFTYPEVSPSDPVHVTIAD